MRYVVHEPSPEDRPSRASVTIRPTDNPADLAVCARLAAHYNEESHRVALAGARHHLARPRNVLLVATEPDGGVVGYARITWVPPGDPTDHRAAPSGYYLGGMVVAEDHRRRGVGSRLTAERIRIVAERAHDVWYIVNDSNRASIDLHTAHGFHPTTRDFTFPGVVLDGPNTILWHRGLDDDAQRCRGCPPPA